MYPEREDEDLEWIEYPSHSGRRYVDAEVHMKSTFKARVNYPILWAEEGESISHVHYNQVIRLLVDIRDTLWERQTQQTDGSTTMTMNVSAPLVDHETSNGISSKVATATGAEKR